MKIVWSIICLQYFGSINKMNLKDDLIVRLFMLLLCSSRPVPHFLYICDTPPGIYKLAYVETKKFSYTCSRFSTSRRKKENRSLPVREYKGVQRWNSWASFSQKTRVFLLQAIHSLFREKSNFYSPCMISYLRCKKIFLYFIQHCFICHSSDSTVSEDAGIEPRTVGTSTLAVRCSNHSDGTATKRSIT
jgi:hypothetical protein